MERFPRPLPAVEPLESRIAPAAVVTFDVSSLDGKNGFQFHGGAAEDLVGISVKIAGDVNGDGFDDLIVGAPGAVGTPGLTYVIFGQAGVFAGQVDFGSLEPSDLVGSNGFVLTGVNAADAFGIAVAGAGDVNGDGFGDIIVGANGANEGGTLRGAAYVVFGKAGGFAASVAVGTLTGADGFKLSGAANGDQAGVAVSGAGDVNGDGYDDVIVGAQSAAEGGTARGAAYLVFGKPSGFTSSLGLGALDGSNGVKLVGAANNDHAGNAVSTAGDVNGDGFGDVIVGAYSADEGGTDRGAAYVVFGRAGGFGTSVALGALTGVDGFKLSGPNNGEQAGLAVSAGGDVNGDGFGDVIVGAPLAAAGGTGRGAAYVVLGHTGNFTASIGLGTLTGPDGFTISGTANNQGVATSVSSAGDFNGDGFGDLLIGAPSTALGGFPSGAAYVVFGKAASFGAGLTVTELDGNNGFTIPAIVTSSFTGITVSGGGDVNGDGFADLIIGAPFADSNQGTAYVVHGFGTSDVTVDAKGKTATFTDWDGDLVTIKTTKGSLNASQFHLSSPNPATGGAHLVHVDLTAAGDGTDLTLTAKRGPLGGDSLVNVGSIDGGNTFLGKVTIDGDLQQIDAMDLAGLTVYSLGQNLAPGVHGEPLTSHIQVKLGALTVKTDISHVTLNAERFGAIKAGSIDDAHIVARGVLLPPTVKDALAIASLTVNGTVRDSQILASTGFLAAAPAQIGAVKVLGQWIASDLAAGVRVGTGGIFATGEANEHRPTGGLYAFKSKIASIAITGGVFGTPENLRDGFGFASEEIGSLKIGKATVPLTKGADTDNTPIFLGVTGDVRVRESGTAGAPTAPIVGPAGPDSIGLAFLNQDTGFRVIGVADGDFAGFSVSAAGDVNGDGFGDFIVGAERSDANGGPGTDRGAAFVVFGQVGGFPTGFSLAAVDGVNGFALFGGENVDSVGYSVSAAGDVNGDGFDDVIVGAPGANAGGGVGANRGQAYVIFGKATPFAPSLVATLLTAGDGFIISGIADGDQAGFSVSGAGDVNHDGFADVIVGANFADEGGSDRGAAYVIFGRPDSIGANLPLSSLDGSNGFKLSGAGDQDKAGFGVSGAGDVNGDGFDDFLVGAPFTIQSGADSGAAYLVFGKAGGFGASVALGSLNGSNGFKLSGAAPGDKVGYAVSGAGDINGDGFGDLIIGAGTAAEGGTERGAAYVVLGKAGGFGAEVELGTLAVADGFKLSGIADGDRAGEFVSGAGDINGDGLDDLVIGAPFASAGNDGAAYVVFGKMGGFSNLVLSALDGRNGFELTGAAGGDYAGWSVSEAGDINGDGFADLIVGAYGVDGPGIDRGAAYVVYGFGAATVNVDAKGKTATFTDWDGDLVTVKTSKGTLDATQFRLSSPNPATGGSHLTYADFTNATNSTEFGLANLTFTAKRGPTGGDGLVNVGTLAASLTSLGKVSIDGDLQQIDAQGIASLTVYSLGQFAAPDAHGALLRSDIFPTLGALTVKTDASRVTIDARSFGAIKALSLDHVQIRAGGIVNPAKASNAVAIKSLTVGGSVSHSQIVAGFTLDGIGFNADVQIGAVKVLGNWTASDLVASVTSGDDHLVATGDQNEALIAGGNAIVAKIASITIIGAVRGTGDDLRDGYGFAAEEFGALSIGKAKIALQKGARNDTTPLILAITGDTRVREVAG